MLLTGEGEKQPFLNTCLRSVLLNKVRTQGKLVNQPLKRWSIIRALLTWRKKNTQLQPALAILSHLRGQEKKKKKKLRNSCKVHSTEAQAH